LAARAPEALSDGFPGDRGCICLGQHVARVEIDELLRETFARLTDFELAGAPEWLASNFISGPRALPARFRLRSGGC
jgi:hypothetical protein